MRKNVTAFIFCILLLAITGCFNETQKDSGNGVKLQRSGNSVNVIATKDMDAGEYNLGNAVTQDNITTNSKNLLIVNGKEIAIASTNGLIKAGDVIFTINNTTDNISVNEKVSMKKNDIQTNGKRAAGDVLLGDFNNSGDVEVNDFIDFAQNYGKVYNAKYDIAPAVKGTGAWLDIYCKATIDGTVGIDDFIIFAQNYSKKKPIDTVVPVSLTLAGGNTIAVGASTTITATVNYSDGSSKVEAINWTTSSTTVVKITPSTNTCLVTGVAGGTAVITAEKSGLTATTNIIVTAPVNGIKLHVKGYTHIWAWNETATSTNYTGGTWPGKAMTEEKANWYGYTLDVDAAAIIFSNNGAGQTANLKQVKGEWWYADSQWYDHDVDVDTEAPYSIESTPAAGNVEATSITVTLIAKDKGDPAAKIYYTVDGTTPVVAKSPLYGTGINLTANTTIKAIAQDKSLNTSQVFTFTFKLGQDATAPVVTPTLAQGRYETVQTAKFTVTDNKDTAPKAYFTEDGSAPTASSTLYTGQSFTIDKNKTINFYTIDNAGNFTTYTFAYQFGKLVRNDFRDESIYFVVTSRFYDGVPSNNRYSRADDNSGNRANNDPPWRGDFKGLIDKLDYIKALGFTAVWITPVVQNRSDYDFHGYHTWDFNKIDARLETPGATYQDLINAVHSRGMKIIQDIVLNHTSRYGAVGLQTPKYWGDRDDPEWGVNGTDPSIKGYYDAYNPNFTYNGLDKEPNSGKEWYNGDLWQKEVPSNVWVTPNSGDQDISTWGKIAGQVNNKPYKWHYYQWPTLALFDPKYFHKTWLKNWEDETCQTGTMHEDCIDLNTESKEVQDHLIAAYNKMIDMGVDGFRIDTVKHINRLMFNKRFIPAFKQRGGDKFFMFGEVCTRVNEVWNKGNAPLSTPFFTWKERKDYSADDAVAVHEQYAYEWGQGVNGQPTSTNHQLIGNDYHTPDYSKYSGMSVIDFPMHWNFKDAGSAFGIRGGDHYYNDATWNVTYVESHDYSPWEAPQDRSYRAPIGEEVWAEDMDLMWTFRGIPCLYYGDEIQMAKGNIIDAGPTMPLEKTGRPYFGDKIAGNVSVQDFGVWSNASGAISDTLSHPLAKHVQRLNRIRRAIPALQKGQYSTEGVSQSGVAAFKRRFTDKTNRIDSYVLVTISGDATFTGVLNGTYVDAVTGDKKVVTNGNITLSCPGKGNMRAYVLELPGNPAPGKIGDAGTYLK